MLGGVRVAGGDPRNPNTHMSPEMRMGGTYKMIVSPISGTNSNFGRHFPELDGELPTTAEEGMAIAKKAQRDAIASVFTYAIHTTTTGVESSPEYPSYCRSTTRNGRPQPRVVPPF